MSIVTLKNKTATKYNNMSVSQPLFSLNGTRRSQGYVGQTSLSRSLPRTLIKNGGYKNYGGCCGQFPIGQIILSSITTTEDNTVVKSSTLNTKGLLHVNSHACLWRPAPYTNVKMDSNRNLKSQSSYVKIVHQNTIQEADACRSKNKYTSDTCISTTNCAITRPRYTPFKNAENWTKPASDFIAISQGEYLLKLDKQCGVDDASEYAKNTNTCISCALPGGN
jgi:hypothetical protein